MVMVINWCCKNLEVSYSGKGDREENFGIQVRLYSEKCLNNVYGIGKDIKILKGGLMENNYVLYIIELRRQYFLFKML